MPYEQLLVFVYSGLSTNPRFIMYLTFIVCTGKMRIKNSYVLRGLRHPLGEIIMNEYE